MKKTNLKDQLIRALADYDNLRKRSEAEQEIWLKFAAEKLLRKFLPILDALRQAQTHLKDSGLAITIREIEDLFKEEGLEEIKVEIGANFDHNLHEAVEVVEGKAKEAKIKEVVLSGWRFTNGPILRHAKVKVYK
jgi:molecular chaperone GrpE